MLYILRSLYVESVRTNEMNKDEIQEEAYVAWQNAGYIGTVIMGTGLGKTRLGGNAIRALRPTSTLVVTSRVNLIKQWESEINLPNVDYMCINTAYKVSGQYDLLIVDECHRSVSASFRSVYTNIKYKKLLCLTATLPEKNSEFLLEVAPIVYTKSIQDVQGNEEVVSDYYVYNFVTGMDKKTEQKYKLFTTLFTEASIQLSKIMRFSDEKFASLYDFAKYYSKSTEKTEVVRFSKQYWSSMSMRRLALHNNTAKIKVAHDVVQYLGPERVWLVLCSSIDYAKMLHTVLGGLIYHSGMSKDDKEETLRKFKAGENRILVGVKALNEGLDVPEADSVLVVSGDSTELEATQVLGRIIRARHGKKAIMINLTTTGTAEEKWVSKRSSQFKPKWINNLSQI